MASDHLVRGCEGAVSELHAATGSSESQSPAEKRAEEILAEVLSSWREALKALGVSGGQGAPAIATGSLDRWTGDELFNEAVARSTGDTPALRAMEALILRALIHAHDGAPSREYANANS
jgi:hypothetical protein